MSKQGSTETIKYAPLVAIPVTQKGFICARCPAWRGCLGQEPTVELYIAHLMQVMAALWRVLRDDGVCWVNLDDTRLGSWGNYAPGGIKGEQRLQTEEGRRWARPAYADTTLLPPSAKAGRPKDMALVPEHFILAAQAQGWYVRSKVVWWNPGTMPESANDRPTDSYQLVFMLTKSGRYWFDSLSIAEDAVSVKGQTASGSHSRNVRHARNVQTWPTEGLGSFRVNGKTLTHFAAFPRALPNWCIRASCPATCCGRCGAGYARVIEKPAAPHDGLTATAYNTKQDSAGRLALLRQASRERGGEYINQTRTLGWYPTCACIQDIPTVPGLVLDPFLGSGTTALAAQELGRHCVGIDLSADYIALAQHRLEQTQPALQGIVV